MLEEPAHTLISWMKVILIVALVLLVARQFIYEPVEVHGKSMMPTFEENDRIILMKISEIEPFDMIVFKVADEKNYLKRVIGIAGDTVEIAEGTLQINGVAAEEPYLKNNRLLASQGDYGQMAEDFPAITVPAGYYFVLGDNRLNSVDSRMIGFIKKEDVIGEVMFRLSPAKQFGPVE
ncbi:signal peptidase I [Planococcus salinarum]|nr:signal peptidase I [Planococcus salinarum]